VAKRGERPIPLSRVTTITLDADLGRPRTGYTAEEHRLRDRLEREIAMIRRRGGFVEIPFDLPDLD
jgi:hypothetical protein